MKMREAVGVVFELLSEMELRVRSGFQAVRTDGW
jgi:hypothetical protein